MFHKRYLVIIIILFILSCIFLFRDNRYKDDFYLDVNRKKIDSIKLEKDKYTWSVFSDAQDKSDIKVKEIVKNAINGNDTRLDSDIVKKINRVWNSANDMNKRNRDGVGSLDRYLKLVNSSSNIKELLDSIILIENDLGIDILTNVRIGADYKNNSKYIIYLYPVTFFGGSSSDYYVNPDYMTYKAYLKKGIIEILMAYGYDKKKARNVMHNVIAFYEDIGNNSKLSDSLEDINEYYNIINNKDISNIYNNIDIKYYLEKRGIYKYNNYSIVDKGQYEILNKKFNNNNLNIWKEIILLKILSGYGEFLSDEYIKVIDDISNGIMGVDNSKSIEDKNIDLIKELFSYDIDFLYSDVLKSEEKKKISSMVDDIKDYYGEMLDNNTWLERDTIDKAKNKLDNMKVHIGVEKYNKISIKYSVSDNLIDSVINILKVNNDYEFSLLEKGDSNIKSISDSIVNAYYVPNENAIYIPSSIKYLYDSDGSYYQMLGSIGMVIAHEITHAFDMNGSKFDEKGNMNNWWSNKDLNNYKRYRDEVISYYNQYEVIKGIHINGKKTVNENIADLGALACISGIANNNSASNNEIKSMYYSFAKMWASKEKESYTKLLLLQDNHSPNKYRVNAVLSSTDLYYKIFKVNMFDKMYKKNRVKVW